ncbi:hypothetical protein D3C76_1340030 [compost metagenome]
MAARGASESAIAAAAAPRNLIGLQDDRLEAMLMGEKIRRAQAGVSRADDSDIGFGRAFQRTIVLSRITSAGHPVGRRVR